VTLQCPSKAPSRKGNGVGGVSERAGVKAGGSNPSANAPSRVVAVEDILVVWKAALFAGRSRNEGLGRSVGEAGILSLQRCADDSGCPEDAEEGNVVAHTRFKAYAPAQAREIVARAPVDASFARSFDPCASILTMHDGAKSAFVVGRALRHHGWANPRKWKKPSLGLDVRA